MSEVNFDAMTREQIYGLITLGILSNEEVTEYYGNEWWDETP